MNAATDKPGLTLADVTPALLKLAGLYVAPKSSAATQSEATS